MQIIDEKFPIGKFKLAEQITEALLEEWIEDIENLPIILKEAVADLTEEQLDTPYRVGGWTIRQVVHHIADSHMNAYMRFRLALTEDIPTIRSYVQANWAELADAKHGLIEPSLVLLKGMHARWATLLRSLTPADFSSKFYHPELKITLPLSTILALYAWHGKHHVGHITTLREKNNW